MLENCKVNVALWIDVVFIWCITLQIFYRLEWMWLAWHHHGNYWKKARHLCKRGTLPIDTVIFMQVSADIYGGGNFICKALTIIINYYFLRKRLLEVFLSLRPENLISSLPNGITYRELKVFFMFFAFSFFVMAWIVLSYIVI